MKSVTMTIRTAAGGWRGTVMVDGDEYARVFTSAYSTALEAAIPYVWSVADEAYNAAVGTQTEET